jgi:CheY-like chemotaxis protein
MNKPRVLDVGNCGYDHGQIARMLQKQFGAEVLQAEQASDTLETLRRERVDLVLINRKLDVDYSDGMEVLKAIKQDPQLAPVPVMLVTNYPEHQAEAVAHGALPGFGKLELNQPDTHARLAQVLTQGEVAP